jgi:hypothetical protein
MIRQALPVLIRDFSFVRETDVSTSSAAPSLVKGAVGALFRPSTFLSPVTYPDILFLNRFDLESTIWSTTCLFAS